MKNWMKNMNLKNMINILKKDEENFPKKLLDLEDVPEKLYVLRQHRSAK